LKRNADQIEAQLSSVIQDFPDFAEVRNRRALLYVLQDRYEEALEDCQQVADFRMYGEDELRTV
jgi:hypothetical protein